MASNRSATSLSWRPIPEACKPGAKNVAYESRLWALRELRSRDDGPGNTTNDHSPRPPGGAMDFFLRRVTDLGLRRIYKFLLKSTIGRYLEDDLLIEQLEVNSRDGVVTLRDIKLNATVLNDEFFASSPVRMRSAVVDEIRVHLSYSTILEDSLKFDLQNVEVAMELNDAVENKDIDVKDASASFLDGSESSHDGGRQASGQADADTDGELGGESLGYIAYWIQAVVAKLKVFVASLTVTIADPAPSKTSEAMRVRFTDISFFNTDPSCFEGRSSALELSSMMMSGTRRDVAENLGAAKVVTVAGVEVFPGMMAPVVSIHGTMRAKVTVGQVDSPSIDSNVDVSSVSVALDNGTVVFLRNFLQKWTTALSSTATSTSRAVDSIPDRRRAGGASFRNSALAHLSHLESQLLDPNRAAHHNEGDFSDKQVRVVMQYMKEYLESKGRVLENRVPAPQCRLHMDSAMSDDEDFPESISSSDNESDDDAFFDAEQGNFSMAASRMGGTRKERGLGRSVHFTETSSARSQATSHAAASAAVASTTRVHIAHLELVYQKLSNEGHDKLVLTVADAVMVVSHAEEVRTEVHLTLSTVSVMETMYGAPPKCLISFHSHRSVTHSIYSSPHVDIKWISRSKSPSPSSSVDVRIEPIILSIAPAQVFEWASPLSGCVATNEDCQDSASSGNAESAEALPFELNVYIPDALLIVLSDFPISDPCWTQFHEALRLDVIGDEWSDMARGDLAEFTKKHVAGTSGGLLLQFHEVVVQVDRGVGGKSAQALSMMKAALSVFVPAPCGATDPFSEYRHMRTELVRAKGDVHSKIRLTQSQITADSATSDRQSAPHSGTNEMDEEMGPIPPSVHPAETIHVLAQNLEADFHQREFYALLMVCDRLVRHTPKSSASTGAFGLTISTKFASILLSENSRQLIDELTRQQRYSAKPFDELCRILGSIRADRKPGETSSPLTICVSIRQPMVELYTVQGVIFVALKANDLSMFEMMPSQFAELKASGFNFNSLQSLPMRMGAGRHRIPFIHRASTPELYKSLHGSALKSSRSSSISLLGDHGRIGHAFEVKIALRESADRSGSFTPRSVHLFVDVYDIMWSHDPASTWLLKMVNLLTPKSPLEMIAIEVDELAKQIESCRQLWQSDDHMLGRINELCDFLARDQRNTGGPAPIPSTADAAAAETFEMTSVLVRVRDSVISYCDEQEDSCAVLSVGLLTLYTTAVSNSSNFALKIGLKDLSMKIAPLTAEAKLSFSALQKLRLAEVLEVDHVSTLIRVKERELEDLSMSFEIGNCLLYGCMDSLDLAVSTLPHWFTSFQQACAESENIIKGKKQTGVQTIATEFDEVDRVRTCVDNETVDGESLQRAMATLGLVVQVRESDKAVETFAAMNSSALGSALKESFFQSDGPADGQRLEASIVNDHSVAMESLGQWIPDYDYDERAFDLMELGSLMDRAEQDDPSVPDDDAAPRPLHTLDDDSVVSGFQDDYVRPSELVGGEFELRSINGSVDGEDSRSTSTPGEGCHTDADDDVEDDVDRAWRDDDADAADDPTVHDAAVDGPEQHAKWYAEPLAVLPNYIPVGANVSWTALDPRPDAEKQQRTDLALFLSGNVKIRFFAGSEWAGDIGAQSHALPRSSKEFVEVTIKGAHLHMFSYRPAEGPPPAGDEDPLPAERVQVNVGEWLVTFGGAELGQRRKLFGLWSSPSRPRDLLQPAIAVAMVAFLDSASTVKEHRMRVAILPLRCHLTSEFLDFAKGLASHFSGDESLDPPSGGDQPSSLHFQHFELVSTDLKVDYHASHVSLKALREGDFLQLLNIFPIDGLELKLRALKFRGVSGAALGRKLAQAWVHDIYSTQLHKVLSGTAPLKGLFNVGADLHSLLFVPASKSGSGRPSASMLRRLQKQTTVLARTVARESLDLSHKVTHFLACAITDLASGQSSEAPTHNSQPRGVGDGLGRAYSLIRDELTGAAQTVVTVPIRQYVSTGPSGIFTEVVRALPVAILRPLGGVAHGLAYTILGLRNDIDPDRRADDEDIFHVDLDD